MIGCFEDGNLLAGPRLSGRSHADPRCVSRTLKREAVHGAPHNNRMNRSGQGPTSRLLVSPVILERYAPEPRQKTSAAHKAHVGGAKCASENANSGTKKETPRMTSQQPNTDRPLSLLFENRSETPQSNEDMLYDRKADMNFVASPNGLIAAIDNGTLLSTNSKTMAAPRDDDPDPARSDLY